jgi:hypothetical protein
MESFRPESPDDRVEYPKAERMLQGILGRLELGQRLQNARRNRLNQHFYHFNFRRLSGEKQIGNKGTDA